MENEADTPGVAAFCFVFFLPVSLLFLFVRSSCKSRLAAGRGGEVGEETLGWFWSQAFCKSTCQTGGSRGGGWGVELYS